MRQRMGGTRQPPMNQQNNRPGMNPPGAAGGGRAMPHAMVGAKVLPSQSQPHSSISSANAMNYAQQPHYGGNGRGGGGVSEVDQPKLTLPQALHLVSMRVTSIEKILAKEGLLKMARDGQYEHVNEHDDGMRIESNDPNHMGNTKTSKLGRHAVQAEDLQMMMTRLHAVESSVSDLTKDVATVKASAAPSSTSATSTSTASSRASISPAVVQQMEAFKQGFQKQSAVIKQLSDRLKETQTRVAELETQLMNNQKDIDTLNETLMSVMAQQTVNIHYENGEDEGIGMDEFVLDGNTGAGMDMNDNTGIGLETYVPPAAAQKQCSNSNMSGELSDTSGSAIGFETELDDLTIQLPQW